ncbi:hypothetical protein [Pedobacter sp. UBA4863]|uniref:hypothetical protein n=1 Tax=Pedobacter sp. UBA4863 TaxID=1947060 RepID=UPI0025DF0832|nr:hypothetical protein [Pedobacter sp. UBA4863]
MKKHKTHFDQHNEKIKVKLGQNGNEAKYQSYINREFNKNKTLSIYIGEEYTNWVQANFKLGDTMKVEIVNPNSIILYARGEEH